jgi:hypothetical protein
MIIVFIFFSSKQILNFAHATNLLPVALFNPSIKHFPNAERDIQGLPIHWISFCTEVDSSYWAL